MPSLPVGICSLDLAGPVDMETSITSTIAWTSAVICVRSPQPCTVACRIEEMLGTSNKGRLEST